MLTVGLILCVCTMTQYFFWTPIDNDRSINKAEQGKTVMNRELFDEFGRYVIKDYDANPTFSDFLPVS
jgi:hypothetical protein